jgi:uncharacterized hydrophobic protein (TIGR00271 family)
MFELSAADVRRMRASLFVEGDDAQRKVTSYWLLLVLAAIIASAGVVNDSTATVIGAMIVAPLMAPILGMLLGIVLEDRTNFLRCLALVVLGGLAVVVIGYLVGLLLDTPVVAETNGQVAQRVSPKLMDLLAALATGAVGAFAVSRDDISDTLPGVAVAISLVPPLAVVGLTLESGEPSQAGGALLLFLTNVAAILASGLVVLTAYRTQRLATVFRRGGEKHLVERRAIVAIVAGLAIIAVPLGITSVRVSHAAVEEGRLQEVAAGWAASNDWEVIAVDTTSEGLVLRATGPSPEPSTSDLRNLLDHGGLRGVDVDVELIPSTRRHI